MKFKDIPQLTRDGSYQANIPMRYILNKIKEWEEDDYYQLQLNPKFQRGHVWTEEQQIAYIEFLQRIVRKAHSFRCGMDSTNNVYVDI